MFNEGRYEEARVRFSKAVELAPESAQGYGNLAVVCLHLKHHAESRRYAMLARRHAGYTPYDPLHVMT